MCIRDRSPLLLAASRGVWKTVLALIKLGANIHLKDSNHRNILHLVVMNGGRLDDFAQEIIKVFNISRKHHFYKLYQIIIIIFLTGSYHNSVLT